MPLITSVFVLQVRKRVCSLLHTKNGLLALKSQVILRTHQASLLLLSLTSGIVDTFKGDLIVIGLQTGFAYQFTKLFFHQELLLLIEVQIHSIQSDNRILIVPIDDTFQKETQFRFLLFVSLLV